MDEPGGTPPADQERRSPAGAAPLLWALACVLAAVVLFGRLAFGGLALGNDYRVTQLLTPLEYRFYESVGIEPAWYPHVNGGLPYGGRCLAQVYNLPAWLVSRAPGFRTGRALDLIFLKHLALLALGQWVLFYVLTSLAAIPPPAAFLLSGVLFFQLRTLDALRYGVGLDTAVYLEALFAAWLVRVERGGLLPLAAAAAAVQCLLTAGYPQTAVYGSAGWVLCLGLLLWRRPTGAVLRGSLSLALPALVGAALAAPAWLPIKDFSDLNFQRVVNSSIERAEALPGIPPLDLPGLLRNLCAPWRAEVHSGFGGSTLLSVLLLAVLVYAFLRPRRRWPLVVALAVPVAYALGRATPLFGLFFRAWPGFKLVRMPGKMLSTLTLTSLASLVAVLGGEREESWAADACRSLRLAAVLNLVLLGWAAWSELSGAGAGLPRYAACLVHPWSPALRWGWLAAGAAAAGFLAWRAPSWLRARAVPASAVLLLGLPTLGQVGIVMSHGTWISPKDYVPTFEDFRAADHLPLYGDRSALEGTNELSEDWYGLATTDYTLFRKAAGPNAVCYLPVERGAGDKAVLLPFYLTADLLCTTSRGDALKVLARRSCDARSSGAAIVPDAVCRALPPVPRPAGKAALNKEDRLLALSPNGAVFRSSAPAPAVLVTPYPWAGGRWAVGLDGSPVRAWMVDGGLVGVLVPPGRHTVSMLYASRRAKTARYVALAAALAVLGWLASLLARGWAARGRRWRLLAAACLAGWAALCVRLGALAARYDRDVSRPALLNNSYPPLLDEQLRRWSAGPSR